MKPLGYELQLRNMMQRRGATNTATPELYSIETKTKILPMTPRFCESFQSTSQKPSLHEASRSAQNKYFHMPDSTQDLELKGCSAYNDIPLYTSEAEWQKKNCSSQEPVNRESKTYNENYPYSAMASPMTFVPYANEHKTYKSNILNKETPSEQKADVHVENSGDVSCPVYHQKVAAIPLCGFSPTSLGRNYNAQPLLTPTRKNNNSTHLPTTSHYLHHDEISTASGISQTSQETLSNTTREGLRLPAYRPIMYSLDPKKNISFQRIRLDEWPERLFSRNYVNRNNKTVKRTSYSVDTGQRLFDAKPHQNDTLMFTHLPNLARDVIGAIRARMLQAWEPHWKRELTDIAGLTCCRRANSTEPKRTSVSPSPFRYPSYPKQFSVAYSHSPTVSKYDLPRKVYQAIKPSTSQHMFPSSHSHSSSMYSSSWKKQQAQPHHLPDAAKSTQSLKKSNVLPLAYVTYPRFGTTLPYENEGYRTPEFMCDGTKKKGQSKVQPLKHTPMDAALQLITRVRLPQCPQPGTPPARHNPSTVLSFAPLYQKTTKSRKRSAHCSRPIGARKNMVKPKGYRKPFATLITFSTVCVNACQTLQPRQPKQTVHETMIHRNFTPTPDIATTRCVTSFFKQAQQKSDADSSFLRNELPFHIADRNENPFLLNPPGNVTPTGSSCSTLCSDEDEVAYFLQDVENLILQAEKLKLQLISDILVHLRRVVQFLHKHNKNIAINPVHLSKKFLVPTLPSPLNNFLRVKRSCTEVPSCSTVREHEWFHSNYKPSNNQLYDSWLNHSPEDSGTSQSSSAALEDSTTFYPIHTRAESSSKDPTGALRITHQEVRDKPNHDSANLSLCAVTSEHYAQKYRQKSHIRNLPPHDVQLLTREMQPVDLQLAQSTAAFPYYVIQRGSFAMVCAGVYRGNSVAIKMPLPENADGQKNVERFLLEWEILERCNHQGIVNLIGGVLVSENEIWLVLEWVPGPDLHTIRYVERRQFTLYEAARLCYQLATVLNYLHTPDPGNGKHIIVHRDVKPENILINLNDGSLHVCDLGDAEESIDGHLQHIRGATWLYSPPEFLRNSLALLNNEQDMCKESYQNSYLASQWDIWSAGCVFHEILGYAHPFKYLVGNEHTAEKILPLLVSALNENRFLPHIHAWLPEPIQSIIASCLELNPRQRPSAYMLMNQWKILLYTLDSTQTSC